MKIGILTLLTLSFACGKYEQVGSNARVGEIRSMSTSLLSPTDQNNFSQMCNALATKSATLSAAIGVTFTFGTSQTDCDGKSLGSADVQTTIQNSGFGYTFKRKTDGLDFFFPQVETTDTGVLGSICSNLGSSTAFFTTGQEVTYYTTSGVLSGDCSPVAGEICVYVEKGFAQNDNTAKIHTKEWIRVRTNSTQGKIGFFTFRKKVSRSYCNENQVQVLQATLK